MHARSWLSAERLLRQADNWVFIGYSLPPADYEFKHLLKRVELSRGATPQIVLITGGKDADRTIDNYQRFFGSKLNPFDGGTFTNGLAEEAFEHLAKIRALNTLD